jgi:hypothetical protein
VFNSIVLTEQGIWIVIALFYMLDNVKQLHGSRLVFRETWRFGWQATVPSDVLILLNRQIFFLPILLPYVLTTQMEWLTEEPRNDSRIRRADRLLRVARRKAFSLRCISVIAFLAFFVAGPVLTHWRGLVFALIHIAPVYITTLLMLLLSASSDRRFWGLRPAEIVYAVVEAAICPAYLVNATHRVSWKCIRLDVDGAAYGLLRCSPGSLKEFRAALDFALEEMEQKFADDPIQWTRIRTYGESLLG